MSKIKQLDHDHVVGTYGRFDVVLERGKGAECFDENGKHYLDLTSGIGVNSLGFAHDGWVQAVSEQAGRLQHISNLYYTKPYAELAGKLTALTGYDKVFFSNSGAEANEGAIKLARKYSFDKYGNGRNTILSLDNSFHGRTVTTLAATGQDVFHNYFFPFTEGFRFVAANDIEALESILEEDKTICAVLFEFVQGEGGVLPLDAGYIQKAAGLCAERDILMVADEVQTGVGRTGTLLASEQFGITPDITTLAKGLGGGLPIGAVLCSQKTSGVLGAGDHGSTFGGNPVSCAGANVCVDTISSPAFLKEVNEKAAYIRQELDEVGEVSAVSGLGLMIGISLKTKSAKEVAAKCVEYGLLVLTAKEKVRLLPPLNISMRELDDAIAILKQVLTQS